ncbi:MAG: hypothetical protein EOM68_28675, partial [Spirochaetia bacterium]|nr:hypothetical protein [Spirochaetia bacterium]
MIKNDKTDISGVSERLNAYIEGGYKVADAYLLAESYFDIDQWVSAASFYQKVTDACKDKEISGASLNDDEREMLYDSFVLYSICLDNLKDRVMGDEIFCIYA